MKMQLESLQGEKKIENNICESVFGTRSRGIRKNLYRILRDCTPVIADLCLKKAEVRTETVLVKYISNKRTDGMRCDIPCGFGELGKIMAGMKPYKEIKDGKELVDFIIKEEESGK